MRVQLSQDSAGSTPVKSTIPVWCSGSKSGSEPVGGGSIPSSGTIHGALAQLVERLRGTQKVAGSIPVCSTPLRRMVEAEETQPWVWRLSLNKRPIPVSFNGRTRGFEPLYVGSIPSTGTSRTDNR
jgi:hypothetical protein